MANYRRGVEPPLSVRSLTVYLVLAVLVVHTRAVAQPGMPPGSARRPNILFLLSDDQRADTIAALGNRHIRTPNLDRLVRRGTVFTSAHCMGSRQGAVCVPSRAMLLSGRTLFRVNEELLGQSTWAESFGKAGYMTFLTGKWHNQAESALRVFGQGKAIFLGGMGDPYNLPLVDISPQHTLVDRETSGAHSVKLFADAAIKFLGSQTDNAPFLCYVAFNAPHDPRTAPTSFHEWYNAHNPPLPPNFLAQHPFDNGEMAIRDERLRPGRGPRKSCAGIWQTITPPSSSSMNRSDASLVRSKRAADSKTRSSYSRAITVWPSAAMGFLASRISTNTR